MEPVNRPDCPDKQPNTQPTEFWFLAHPLAGDVEGNLKKNAALARDLALRYPNRIIFSPIAAVSFLDDREPAHREIGLKYCKAYMATEIFTGIMLPFPEWISSEGCRKEFSFAFELGMKIEFIDSKTGEVYKLNA